MLPIPIDALHQPLPHTASGGWAGLFNLYQPIIALDTGAISGVETLVRRSLDDGIILMPDSFVPSAERDGSIQSMGRHVSLAALQLAATWTENHPDRYVTVNVSAAETDKPGYAAEIFAMLEQTGTQPWQLCLELTESLPFETLDSFRNLHLLHEAGIRIFLDDFGTGHSSLSALTRLPISGIKIPLTFTSLILHSEMHRTILRSSLALAAASGLDAVVEGIETEEQRALLVEMGAQLGQGFLLSPPLHASEL
ncbi:MAG TPA: EAL domain-containing protein [Burkholderiaceae bacterium]|jgi:EAL domain-containing protein (putative c-di-GMP-specific phosphodiesterase class I)|nr:EAL domain-containing protein [Burkholderiaceae bacterium]